MELKRDSMILNTPPITPHNSLLLTAPHSASASSSGEKMFDLQEILHTNFHRVDWALCEKTLKKVIILSTTVTVLCRDFYIEQAVCYF